MLIEEGTEGDDFFLIKSGEVEITRTRPDGRRVLLAMLGPNQFFGEISFLMRKPRSASGGRKMSRHGRRTEGGIAGSGMRARNRRPTRPASTPTPKTSV